MCAQHLSPTGDETSLLEGLIALAVEEVLRHGDPDAFLASVRERAPREVPEIFDDITDERFRDTVATMIGRALWDAMPLPDNDYRPRPFPQVGRNQPCPCGSGLKFKKCCRDLPTMPAISTELMWLEICRQLSAEEVRTLAVQGKIPAKVLGLASRVLLEEGHPEDVLEILEDVFAAPEKLGKDAVEALEVLFNVYDRLGLMQAKLEAIETLPGKLRGPLRAVVWRHRAEIACNAGAMEVAWEELEKARRDDPKNPRLAFLEIIVLCSSGHFDKAAKEARHWAHRFRRSSDPASLEVAALLDGMADDPVAQSLTEPEVTQGHLLRLRELVAGLASPTAVHGLEETEDGDGAFLAPPPEIEQVERDWADAGFATNLGRFWEPPVTERWLGFLAERPEAFDSFLVLNVLTALAGTLESPAVVLNRLYVEPLVSRGEALFDLALAAGGGEPRIPWSLVQNRQAMALLRRKAEILDLRGETAASYALRERLLALDPDDPEAERASLVDDYLRDGENERALAVAERTPEDLRAETVYGRILALYRLGRRGEALSALVEAYDRLPLVVEYLLGRRKQKPKLHPDTFTIGGADQAWIYQEDMGDVWRADPVFWEWLESSMKVIRKKVRKAGRRRS